MFELFTGGQTYQEIATALGVAVGTVKSGLNHAREWLQDCMGMSEK
ncbi:MAG: hypothetical protein K2V38_06870 [Gemmataceae bacterium]|nr:hypothetical protein [Gemmataceae bacterium]